MDELLSRRTSMPVRLAEHEMLVEPDSVYLLPPMKEMIIRQRRLLLSDKDPRTVWRCRSTCSSGRWRRTSASAAIAVILSGSGSDGSRGIQEISRAGGHRLLREPRHGAVQRHAAERDAHRRRRSGAAAGGDRRGDCGARPPPIRRLRRRTSRSDDETRGVDAILRLLRDEYGIDFSHYKASTVTRRIERRLALNRSHRHRHVRRTAAQRSARAELALRGSADRRHALLPRRRGVRRRSSTDHSPSSSSGADADDQIRVWVPGCATGQEAYSIAMLLHERLSARRRPLNVKILATDVHKTSLEVASAGIYTEQQVAGISAERLERFFTLEARRVPDLPGAAREHRVRAAQPDSRRAVHQARPGHLPQPADLLPAARAEDGPDAVPFLPEAGRLPVPRLERDPRRRCSTSSTRSTSTRRSTASGGTSRCRAT